VSVLSGSKKKYPPAPRGTQVAVLVDVVDLGLVETTYEGKTSIKHQVSLVWQLKKVRDDGKRFLVFSRKYNLSLNEKASLRKDLESWLGRGLEESDFEGFEGEDDGIILQFLETLIGSSAFISVVHREHNGNTYANISTIMPLPEGIDGLEPSDYVRKVDRKSDDPAAHGQVDEDDVPF
jgi:hypothetical protein